MRKKPEKLLEYNKWKFINQDREYEQRIFDYAEAWADTMEREIKNIEFTWYTEVKDLIHVEAYDLSHDVNEWYGFNITGFQFSIALALLKKYWYYGEYLKDLEWSN